MTPDPQSAVVARLPGAAALGLVVPAGATVVPAAAFADEAWTARRLAELAARYGTADRTVLGVLWWYSASAVLVAPALAGLVVGVPLSARAADTSVAILGGAVPIAAESTAMSSAAGDDVAGDLRDILASAVATVTAVVGMRPRPLWAIATDSIASRLLALGTAVGDVPKATALARSLAGEIGPPLLVPRYVDVAGTRFVHRVSCCLLFRAPGQPMCISCPRRPAGERARLLAAAAAHG